ncbi:MAG: creatininase family protein [Salinirussus sp.]
MDLAATAWPDTPEETALAMVPVGSTEQHGPHAPLGTDTLTAAAVAEAGADAYEAPVAVAPPVPVGIAAEHRNFPGTLWVSPDTFRDYVRETIESLAYHGWDRVVVVNGHGGNVDALREVCGTITRSGSAYAVPFTWFEAVDPEAAGLPEDMGHGGALETSLVWHLRPEQVNSERFDDAAVDAAEGWGEWVSGVNLAFDSDEFTSNGVVGDPRESDATAGQALLEQAGAALAELLAAVEDR